MLTNAFNNAKNAHLVLFVNEKTNKKPSPVLMYCSLIALNSSWPAVSKTEIREWVRRERSFMKKDGQKEGLDPYRVLNNRLGNKEDFGKEKWGEM